MIAIIIFIISMGVIGVSMSGVSKNVKYPPEVSLCPDYWHLKPQNGEAIPEIICVPQDLGNKSNMGTIGSKNGKFTDSEKDFTSFEGAGGKKRKCTWANGHGIFWGGITDMGICSDLK